MLVRTLIAGTAAAGLLATFGLVVGRSVFQPAEGSDRFPTVSGNNLDRELLEFPRDFAGDLNLIFVPFLRYQQRIVDTWVPFARELEAGHPGLVYYEMPALDDMGAMGRTYLNETMRAGILDPLSRQRTVTLYLDLTQFMRSLGMPSREDVHVLLVDRDGRILWRTTGPYDQTAAGQLQELAASQSR